MGEYTLDDLVREKGTGGSSGASGGGGGGFDLAGTLDALDKHGVLEPLVGSLTGQQQAGQAPQQSGGQGAGFTQPPDDPDDAHAQAQTADQPADSQMDLDADQIKTIMLKVYDNTHLAPGLSDDPSLSELIKWVDEHQSTVNALLQRGGFDA